MSKRKAIIWPAVCILCFAALVTALGCAPKTTTAGDATSDATSSDSASATTAGGNTTVEKYASAYPLEYNSLMVTWTNANGKLIGHSLFRDICEAPLMRDMNGDVLANADGTYAIAGFHYDAVSGQYVIDELTAAQLDEYGLYQGCVACKSSKFNDLYSSEGAAAFTAVYDADAREVVNGDYFDCALCHTGTPSANSLSANAMYWNALGAGLTENLDTKDQVCAQCHTHMITVDPSPPKRTFRKTARIATAMISTALCRPVWKMAPTSTPTPTRVSCRVFSRTQILRCIWEQRCSKWALPASIAI